MIEAVLVSAHHRPRYEQTEGAGDGERIRDVEPQQPKWLERGFEPDRSDVDAIPHEVPQSRLHIRVGRQVRGVHRAQDRKRARAERDEHRGREYEPEGRREGCDGVHPQVRPGRRVELAARAGVRHAGQQVALQALSEPREPDAQRQQGDGAPPIEDGGGAAVAAIEAEGDVAVRRRWG